MTFIPDGYCDFPGCFNLIGEARFGEDWTGRELGAHPIPSPEERDRVLEEQIEWLKEHQPDDVPKDREELFSLLRRKAALRKDYETSPVIWSDEPLWMGELVEYWEAIDPKTVEYKNLYDEICESLVRKKDVFNEILENLCKGKIRAYCLTTSGNLVDIPKNAWTKPVWNSACSGAEIVFPVDTFKSPETNVLMGHQHRGLALFTIKDIKKFVSGPESPATVAAKTRCKEWLKDKMTFGPKPKPKATLRGEAYDKFGVGPRVFDDAWTDAIEETKDPNDWKKAGRPKKS